MICEKCGHLLRLGEWPWCPHDPPDRACVHSLVLTITVREDGFRVVPNGEPYVDEQDRVCPS